MNNLDWLYENDREQLLEILAESDPCEYCAYDTDDECGARCGDGIAMWLKAEHNDGLKPENGVSVEGADANDGNEVLEPDSNLLEPNTREKLEEVLRNNTVIGITEDSGNDGVLMSLDEFRALLDRQAAITERESAERIRQLEAELNKWRKLTDGIELPDYPMAKFMPKDKDRRIAELEAELRECDEQRIEYRDQRDWYRDRLGDAVWHAHAIARMTEVDV